MTTRTATGSGGTTATLTYDGQDHLVRWNDTNTTSNEEWYLYDASGQRVLRRSQQGGASNTTLTVYAFGLEEHQYSYTGSGSSATNTSNTYYYSLGGHLIGTSNGASTSFLLTDALGSVVSSISNTANSAVVNGNQTYGPYGNQAYSKGTVGTNKGYTGQYNDALTQLDYYGARYYDPFVGVFLSPDTVQGNPQGMNPYNYVSANPETNTDPTGEMYAPPGGGGAGNSSSSPQSSDATPWWQSVGQFAWNAVQTGVRIGNFIDDAQAKAADFVLGFSSMGNDVKTIFDSKKSVGDKIWAGVDLAFNAGTDIALFAGVGEALRGGELLVKGGDLALKAGEDALTHGGEEELAHAGEDLLNLGCSFTAVTVVTTASGQEAIGKLRPGEKVLAYNPHTQKMELQPILHVWIDKDNDLIDLTLTTTTWAKQRKAATTSSETIHTNKKHPFLTRERGFLQVGQITLGMHVLRADGTYGVVTGWKVVPGSRVMYNLEVAQDHTFAVGAGEWVVHNDCSPVFKELQDAGYTLTDHFKQTFTDRASGLTTDNVTGILEDGRQFYDTIESNFVAVDTVKGKGLYRIAYDGGNPWKLLSIAGEKNGAGGIIRNAKRYVLPWTVVPDWTHPFR